MSVVCRTFSSLFIASCSKSSALSMSSFLSLSRLCTKDSSSCTVSIEKRSGGENKQRREKVRDEIKIITGIEEREEEEEKKD